MFDSLFPKHWTTLQRLMWLKTNALARAVYETVTGNPVSFTAKAAPLRKLEVAFSPVQDLHGYDAPWPAGGGKNLFNPADAFVISGYGTFIPGEVKAGETYTVSFANAETGAAYAQRFYINGSWESAGTSIPSTSLITGYTFTAAEGATKFAINGYTDGAPMQLEKGSSATSWTPYSNLCPISGWDSLTVEQTGKNLFDAEHPEKNGYYNVDGEYNSATGYSCYLVPAKAEQKYTCQGNFAGIKTFWDKDLNFISGVNQGGGATKTFTTPAGTAFFRISIAKTSIDGTQQIEFGETASEVVSYNPSSRSISITIGSTVYSGTVDVVTGVGEVTMASVDLGTLDWTYQSAGGGYFVSSGISAVVKPETDASKVANIKCSAYKPDTANRVYRGNYGDNIALRNAIIWVHDGAYTDPEEFTTAVNGVQLVYELAEPITISLTPQEVESLAGDNVLFSDANGDLTVEYRSN